MSIDILNFYFISLYLNIFLIKRQIMLHEDALLHDLLSLFCIWFSFRIFLLPGFCGLFLFPSRKPFFYFLSVSVFEMQRNREEWLPN